MTDIDPLLEFMERRAIERDRTITELRRQTIEASMLLASLVSHLGGEVTFRARPELVGRLIPSLTPDGQTTLKMEASNGLDS